jgi:hypothetical protein
MSLQTHLLDMRLAQAVLMAQQPPAASQVAPGFDLPAGLVADLQCTLRQFGALQHERSTIETVLAAAPAEQRRQAQARLSAFDADLARLLGRAARLAFLRMASQQRRGAAPGIGAARAVQYLGTVFGHTLDAARVRHTVQRIATRPVGAADAVEPGALLETLFIALALLTALAARSPAASA